MTDIWWKVRGAVMAELGTLHPEIDYETRSRIAEDAAREVKKSVNAEIGIDK